MTRIEMAGIALIAGTTALFALDRAPAVAQSEAGRCSVHSSADSADAVVNFSAAVPGVGGGAGPHVLGRVDVTPSSGGPSVVFHAINTKGAGGDRFSVPAGPSVSAHAINTKGSGAADRSVGAGPDVRPVSCAVSTSPSPISRSTCVISGDAPDQTAIIGLLLPAVQKGRDSSARSRPESYDVVLVSRSDSSVGGPRVQCDSPAARRGQPNRASWDLATSKAG